MTTVDDVSDNVVSGRWSVEDMKAEGDARAEQFLVPPASFGDIRMPPGQRQSQNVYSESQTVTSHCLY